MVVKKRQFERKWEEEEEGDLVKGYQRILGGRGGRAQGMWCKTCEGGSLLLS